MTCFTRKKILKNLYKKEYDSASAQINISSTLALNRCLFARSSLKFLVRLKAIFIFVGGQNKETQQSIVLFSFYFRIIHRYIFSVSILFFNYLVMPILWSLKIPIHCFICRDYVFLLKVLDQCSKREILPGRTFEKPGRPKNHHKYPVIRHLLLRQLR